jgi:WD40 repeat protein
MTKPAPGAETEGHDSVKVFLSYSRKNAPAAEVLETELSARGYAPFRDKHDILPGEPWQERLSKLIEAADAVIVLLSPDWVASKICDWEINEAERLGKRVLPAIVAEVVADQVPGRLSRLNYIFLRPQDDRTAGLTALASALNTDIAWVREHTRLEIAAQRWLSDGRTDGLLRGDDMLDAERWLARRSSSSPSPTEAQLAFIDSSQRLRDRQRKIRTYWRNGLTVAAMATTLVVSTLGLFFYWAWSDSQRRQSLFLADLARQESDAGNHATAMLLAIEGLQDADSGDWAQRLRPYVPEAEAALDRAWRENRELSVYGGHTRGISELDVSSDGSRVVTTDHAQARVWSLVTRQTISVVDNREGNTVAMAFSPDGRTLFGARGRAAGLWDATTGQPLGHTADHPSHVSAVRMSHDGERLLTVANADWNSTAHVWTVPGLEPVTRFAGHRSGIWSIGFTHDSASAVTTSGVLIVEEGGLDHTARIWNAETGQETARFDGHSAAVVCASLSPRDPHLVTASADQTSVLWNIESQSRIADLDAFGSGSVTAALFSPDGQTIATSREDGTIRLWNGRDGTELARLTASGKPEVTLSTVCKTLAFSPDSKTLASATGDARVQIWDVASGGLMQTLGGHLASVTGMAFTSDGRRLVTISSDGTARIWDSLTGTPAARLAGVENTIRSTALSTELSRILTASRQDTTVVNVPSRQPVALRTKVGDVQAVIDAQAVLLSRNGKPCRLVASSLRPVSVEISPDARRVVAAYDDGTARIFDAATCRLVTLLEGHDTGLLAAFFTDDGSRVVTQDGQISRSWIVHDTRGLLRAARAVLPRCLTHQQRRKYFLPDTVPAWCPERQLWPFQSTVSTSPLD